MTFRQLSKITNALLNSELKVDLNGANLKNDITTQLLIKKKRITANIINKESIIFCGGIFIKNFYREKFPEITVKVIHKEGAEIKKNSILITLVGNANLILTTERTILNFLQHLCSISTETSHFVSRIKKFKTKLLDTRKTTTGLRKLEKYATQTGGAVNHRLGLYDDILIKDNHIKVLGGVDEMIEILKKKKIENYKVECDNFFQVKKCIGAGAKYILLDNMKPHQVKKIINSSTKESVIFEISGGINLSNITEYAKVGAHFISTSKITLCTKPVDISLDLI